MYEIDCARLYHDLQEHFGTAHAVSPWIHSEHWLTAALGELDTLADNDNWDAIADLAIAEGFNLENYVITDAQR